MTALLDPVVPEDLANEIELMLIRRPFTSVQPPQRRTTNGIIGDRATAAAASRTVNYPSGSQSGDLLVMISHSYRNAVGSYTHTTPSGWTKVDGMNTSTHTTGQATQVWSIYYRFRSTETSVQVTSNATGTLPYWFTTIIAYDGATVNADNPIAAAAPYFDNRGTYTANEDTDYIPEIVTPVGQCDVIWHSMLWMVTATLTATWGTGTEILDVTTNISGLGVTIGQTAAVTNQASAGLNAAQTLAYSAASGSRFMTTIAVAPAGVTVPYFRGFDITGTWVAPFTGNVTVRCWGSGGGGGGSSGTSNNAGAGGGGGAYSEKLIAVTSGTTYNFTVGTGGLPGTTTTAGGAGPDTWFLANDSTGCVAKGGTGGGAGSAGTPGSGGAAASGFGDTKYSGGDGSQGTTSGYAGGGGSAAGTTGNGNNAGGNVAENGGAPKSRLGAGGGWGRNASGVDGQMFGRGPGGGGAGGRRVSTTSTAGAPGMQGRIELVAA